MKWLAEKRRTRDELHALVLELVEAGSCSEPCRDNGCNCYASCRVMDRANTRGWCDWCQLMARLDGDA